MRKLKIWFSALLIGGTISIFAFTSTFAISSNELIALTNDQRANAGLSALSINNDLMSSSAAKAQDMITRDYWAHNAPDGTTPWFFISQSGYNYTRAGENLAMGFTTDQDVINAWMNSPEHRANILNPYYKDIGMAVIQGVLQGQETTLVVAHYGTPVIQPTPSVAPVTPVAPVAVTASANSPSPVPSNNANAANVQPLSTQHVNNKSSTTKKTSQAKLVLNFITLLETLSLHLSWIQILFS